MGTYTVYRLKFKTQLHLGRATGAAQTGPCFTLDMSARLENLGLETARQSLYSVQECPSH